MNDETVAAKEGSAGGESAHDGLRAPVKQQKDAQARDLPIVIGATFTADLVREPLQFWLERLEVAAAISFAPYAQLLQELLNPNSRFSQNVSGGFNVLLIRPEDWIRDRQQETLQDNLQHLRRTAHEFVAALEATRARTGAATLVVQCPPSSRLPRSYLHSIEELQSEIGRRVAQQSGVHWLTHEQLMRAYPVREHEDGTADRIGHLPYTTEYFAAIATLVARRIAVLVKPPYKVIAVDCDNTLWQGVCGEDGPMGVEFTAAHLDLQKLLVRQYEAGMLLCLCTKNNATDIEAVFDARPEMVLRRAHLAAVRVNWEAKSANLRTLADELGLALDSFVFIDDSALECEEVRRHCPSVLTLQYPQTRAAVTHLMNHVWAFDRVGVTAEARQRTRQYQQNRARTKALQEVGDLREFLASLELTIELAAIHSEHLDRAAELTLRTNQFNLTTVRRTASELGALCKSGELEGHVVHVRDRFGDYGLVGLVLLRRVPAQIEVDTLLLSCRVLGRGVEHHIIKNLGRTARAEGRTQIILHYRHTSRSAPARAFLEKSFGQFRTTGNTNGQAPAESVFVVPALYAESLDMDQTLPTPIDEETASHARPATRASGGAPPWPELAYRLTRIEDIVSEIRGAKPRPMQGAELEDIDYCAPRTPAEAAVAEIWVQVLRVPRVGALDNFFDLGGDSLMAVQVVSRIGSQLGLEVALHELFEQPTVEAVALRLAAASRSGGAIRPAVGHESPPLSSAQQRLWFIDQLEGGSTAYHIPLALRLQGALNAVALQAALDALLARHEALRTTFAKINGQPVQCIHPAHSFALDRIDLRTEPPERRETQLRRLMQQEVAMPFSLRAGPLVRGKLLQLDAREHVLLITMHHIVSDGWSIGVFIRELGVLYEAFCDGRSERLPPLNVQYADYAIWQRQGLYNAEVQEQLTYWLESLRGAAELLALPADRPRPLVQSYRGSSVPILIDTKVAAALHAFSRRHQATLAMTLFAAWSLLLSRLSGQIDLVIGVPVANRRRTELESLIGLFVNSMPVRIRLDDDPTLTRLIEVVRHVMVGAYSHQDVPFERVVEVLQPVRSLSHGAIFQVMFVLQNAPREALRLTGLSLAEEEVASTTSQFDLTLVLQESAAGITGSLIYATDLFDRTTIERWAEYFKIIVDEIIEEQPRLVSSLRFLPAHERRLILESFNSTDAPYPRDESISHLFEQQVARTPNAIACIDDKERLSYRQLNESANRLARYLAARGAMAGDYVPVLMARSARMLITQLAILKLGAVYVPIDPELPDERRRFVILDCAARTVVADLSCSESIRTEGVDRVDLSLEWPAIEEQSQLNLERSIDAASPAYVMYTSGSTGIPKGVAVPHRAVNRLVINNNLVRIEAADSLAHHSSPVFDASTLEVWGALLNGAKVVVVPQGVALEPHRFAALLEVERVTILYMSVGLFNQYAAAMANVFSGLRCLMVGGDSLDPATVRRVLQNSPPARLLNVYGPTECTTISTSYEIEAVAEGAASIPIGRPISNTQVFILDSRLEPVAIGVRGEIYIGGDGVACGYLNRPDFTAERFISSPFGGDGNSRLYKTGDQACWRADGVIEFLGRNDYQVKIRGFRIELGEIEAQLSRHPAVAEAIVLARQDDCSEKRLIAYVVADNPASMPSSDQLTAYLRGVLPEYMVPDAFVVLERFPLTATGKVDRRALPTPELEAYRMRHYEAPRGDAERSLAEVWQKLLRIERVGRDDNFFELGGHSLLAMQLVAHAQSAISIDIPVRLIFEWPVLKDLATRVSDLRCTDLVAQIEDGGDELERLLENIVAMPDGQARELLDGLEQEGRS